MMNSPIGFVRPSLCATLGAALLLLAGCAGDSGPRPGRGGRGGGPADAASPRAAPMPEMAAHATYFAGQIEAEVLLGRSGFSPRDSGGPVASGRGGGGRDRGGFSAGMGGGGGGKRGGGGGSRGGEMPRARPDGDGEPRPNVRPSNAPPVQFRLRLTNRGAEPVEVEVPDFNSALGNFVVQPRKLSIPPGGSVEAEPMTSRLAAAGAEVSLTLGLRLQGRTEQQILTLLPQAPAAPAAAPPPSP